MDLCKLCLMVLANISLISEYHQSNISNLWKRCTTLELISLPFFPFLQCCTFFFFKPSLILLTIVGPSLLCALNIRSVLIPFELLEWKVYCQELPLLDLCQLFENKCINGGATCRLYIMNIMRSDFTNTHQINKQSSCMFGSLESMNHVLNRSVCLCVARKCEVSLSCSFGPYLQSWETFNKRVVTLSINEVITRQFWRSLLEMILTSSLELNKFQDEIAELSWKVTDIVLENSSCFCEFLGFCWLFDEDPQSL